MANEAVHEGDEADGATMSRKLAYCLPMFFSLLARAFRAGSFASSPEGSASALCADAPPTRLFKSMANPPGFALRLAGTALGFVVKGREADTRKYPAIEPTMQAAAMIARLCAEGRRCGCLRRRRSSVLKGGKACGPLS